MQPCDSFRCHCPCSIMVVGPSSCGKTIFVEKLLKERNPLFSRPRDPVVYCNGANRPETFERMRKEQGIHFYKGIPDTSLLDKWYKKSDGGILVLDDLMREGSDDTRVLDLFTKDSHHRRITVIHMTQDMFPKGKFAKTVSRMLIILLHSRILEINWGYAFLRNRHSRKNLKMCSTYIETPQRDLMGI